MVRTPCSLAHSAVSCLCCTLVSCHAARACIDSIVLTTHSMEEADTLCTRIGIMAQGKMRSLGSSTELKTRHGQGYRLSFTLKQEGGGVDEALLRNELCPTATLIYSFNKSRVYLLPTEGAPSPPRSPPPLHVSAPLLASLGPRRDLLCCSHLCRRQQTHTWALFSTS